MSFESSIRAAALKQMMQVDTKIESMAVELFTNVVNFSPSQPAAKYSKGEFINNWMTAINSEDTSTHKNFNMDGADSHAGIAAMRGQGTFLCKDGYVTLSNSVDYAQLVEYTGWPKEINPRWTGLVTPSPYAPVRTAWATVIPRFKM